MDDLVAIARIVKPRGLIGEVTADILTDFPERFDRLKQVTAVMPDASRCELKIEGHWFQSNRIVFKFSGYDSIEQSETLRDAEICVAESETIELDTDEFYDWQLVDCEVEAVTGERIGKVRELIRTGGTEILVVDGEKEFLVPFAATICVEVDVENKLIRIDPPEGLLEF
jgi:16S rRNA processing protein RimM